jgi:hypothetical protein
MEQDPYNSGNYENFWRKWVMVAEVDKQSVAAAEVAAMVAAVAAYAAMAPDHLLVPLEWVVIHSHVHHSHHPEVHYAHPAGHQEADPQVYNPDNTYLDISGTMFHQTVLG